MFRTKAAIISLTAVSLLSFCAPNTLTVSADTDAASPRRHQSDSRSFHSLDEIRRTGLLLGSLGTVLSVVSLCGLVVLSNIIEACDRVLAFAYAQRPLPSRRTQHENGGFSCRSLAKRTHMGVIST